MPPFRYKAADASGKVIHGEIIADSLQNATDHLDIQGLLPLEVNPATSFLSRWQVRRGGARWRIEDKVLFTQKFASLIKAGIPLLTALELVARQTKKVPVRTALRHVADQIANGQSLHEAMSGSPRLFDEIYLGAVQAGESTGQLDSTLSHTADYLEREMNTRRKVKEAFRYPMMVVAAIGIAGVLILKFVVPKFASIYGQFGSDLPLPTRILMHAAEMINHVWWFLPPAVVTVWTGWRFWMRTDYGREWRDRNLLRLPIIGSLFLRVAVCRFARLFSVLFSAGLPATTSLEIVADAVGNVVVAKDVQAMRERISAGGAVGEAAADAVMPELVHEMLTIGFESGQVERMLTEVARHFEQEVEYGVRRLADRLQPVILMFLAAAVLTIALAVLMPMWNLISLVR
ncbi:MAG TPA: type II secretion system F family protein [Acidobacteriota bacterium]|nr:type II secretion system F family protein [Acidobacteriota bacterium]